MAANRTVMNQLVVLNLGTGDLQNGFPAVTVELWLSGNTYPMKFVGSLPAIPELPQLYGAWQLLYSAVYNRLDWHPRIEILEADVTHVSEVEFSDLCQRLTDAINTWLNSESFRNIHQQLRTHLTPSAEIRFIIETNNNQLRRLPWHLWNFFEDYSKAEVALSAPEYQPPRKSLNRTPGAKVRILAIFGNSKGIDISKDRVLLEQLSAQAEIEFLVEPQREELNDQLWKQGWDILFFAGHSSSQDQGLLKLNATENLALSKLRNALKKAIESGLKLAIFNSCDGLGLAQQLEDLHIPQVIVMREPVSDAVAQEFLKHLLTAFSSGQSLYTAVREARERLQGLEGKYPCASWLPVICQNPAEIPTTWQDWCESQHNHADLPGDRRLRAVLLTSMLVTACVMGARYLGVLQPLELQALDQFTQLRPDEGQDSRLLVVTITEDDLQLPEQKQRKGSLSDLALTRLLEKLESYQPRAIGLDVYRDFPVDSQQPALAAHLHSNKNLFGICKVRDRETNHPGIAPPPEIPIERQGFSDVVKDPDGILRRQLVAMNPGPTSPCTTPYALSAQLALHYLETEGIAGQYTPAGELQLGNTILKRLQPHRGGYQQVDTWGYQILLNYRSYRSPAEIVPTVTLAEVLAGAVKPDVVRDRIVLIGVTAQSAHDYILTPYRSGQGFSQEIPGVVVQAQMVSQILSAVKDGRSLLGYWPLWGEVLWVGGWSVVGGILVWRWRSQLQLLLVAGATLGGLYIFCFSLFTQGSWVPLVPAALAFVLTGSSVGIYSLSQGQRSHSSITSR
jgi:CHASE2 domain-containing sensor protein